MSFPVSAFSICLHFWTGKLPNSCQTDEAKAGNRVNIANANVFGLSKELDLTRDNRYNIALVIFFVPYILFEIPSNVLLKKFSPKVWLSGCMFMFGLVTICQGLVHSYGGLLAARFFLGFFETGMFPGCKYFPRSSTFEGKDADVRYGRFLFDWHVVSST